MEDEANTTSIWQSKINWYSYKDRYSRKSEKQWFSHLITTWSYFFFFFFCKVLHNCSHVFIVSLDFILKTLLDQIKGNVFTIKKLKTKNCPSEIIKDAVYPDDLALLNNSPSKAKSRLHSLEHESRRYCIFLEPISTLSGRPLNLADNFTYLGRNISSAESDVKIRQRRGLLLVSYRSYLISPIK